VNHGPETPAGPDLFSVDPRPLLDRAAAQFAELIAAVPADRLDAPTPCTDFSVRDLIGHTLRATEGFAVAAEAGGKRPAPGAAEQLPADGELKSAFDEARRALSAAWADDALLDAEYDMPWGKMPGRGTLGGAVMETVAHTWDLATALGRSCASLDPEPAEYALAVGHAFLTADRRGPEVPFDEVREAPEGAGVYERLAAWLGRRTDWAAAE